MDRTVPHQSFSPQRSLLPTRNLCRLLDQSIGHWSYFSSLSFGDTLFVSCLLVPSYTSADFNHLYRLNPGALWLT